MSKSKSNSSKEKRAKSGINSTSSDEKEETPIVVFSKLRKSIIKASNNSKISTSSSPVVISSEVNLSLSSVVIHGKEVPPIKRPLAPIMERLTQIPIALTNVITSYQDYDLTNFDFTGQQLEGYNFDKHILRGANFTNCNLSRCSFMYADLQKADFTGAILHEADLRYAKMYSCILEGTDFTRACLNGAHMDQYHHHTGVILKGTIFNHAEMRNVVITPDLISSLEVKDKIQHVSFIGADLTNSSFNLAGIQKKGDMLILDNANLTGAYLLYFKHINISMLKTKLSSVYFVECEFEGINFDNLDLSRSHFGMSKFKKCSFVGAELINIKSEDSKYEEVNFTGANFYESELGNILNCNFTNSNFINSTLPQEIIGCVFINTDFNSSTMSHCDFTTVAKLENCNFARTIMKSCDVGELQLVSTNFEGSDISECDFNESNLANANFNECSIDDTYFDNCNLDHAFFREASITNSTFNWNNSHMECTLENAVFSDANLKSVDFSKNNLTNAIFTDTNFTNVCFENTILVDTDLADLTSKQKVSYSANIIRRLPTTLEELRDLAKKKGIKFSERDDKATLSVLIIVHNKNEKNAEMKRKEKSKIATLSIMRSFSSEDEEEEQEDNSQEEENEEEIFKTVDLRKTKFSSEDEEED